MESTTDTLIQNSRQVADREGIDFVSEYDFHKLFTESPGASFIIQGYARMLGCETYSYTHTKLTVDALRAFVAAYKREPNGHKIDDLWGQVRDIFGLPKETPAVQAAEEEPTAKSDK